MVRLSFCKKLLEVENVLFKTTMAANAHGRLLGGLRYAISLKTFDQRIFFPNRDVMAKGNTAVSKVCIGTSDGRPLLMAH